MRVRVIDDYLQTVNGIDYVIIRVIEATVSEIWQYINWSRTMPDMPDHMLVWGPYAWLIGDNV